MTWTYDPLLVRNARLNLVRLRARGVAFLPNLYGPLGGLYGGLPTDRFEVLWRLDAPEVEAAARGREPKLADAASLPAGDPRPRPEGSPGRRRDSGRSAGDLSGGSRGGPAGAGPARPDRAPPLRRGLRGDRDFRLGRDGPIPLRARPSGPGGARTSLQYLMR